MKKSFVAALAVAVLGAMTLGAVASSASAPHKPTKNIVQTAVAAGSFKTLVSLVKRAGLAGALSGRGPLTVFAPTDAAFAKVPKATLAALAKDKSKLKAVLLYHVVSGRFTAAQVVEAEVADHAGGRQAVDPDPRRQRLRQPGARDQGQRRGLQRRDPRDQPGVDPGRLTANPQARPGGARSPGAPVAAARSL